MWHQHFKFSSISFIKCQLLLLFIYLEVSWKAGVEFFVIIQLKICSCHAICIVQTLYSYYFIDIIKILINSYTAQHPYNCNKDWIDFKFKRIKCRSFGWQWKHSLKKILDSTIILGNVGVEELVASYYLVSSK